MVSHDAADAAVEIAESAGLTLDESQRHTMRCWLGEVKGGRWAAFEAAHVMGRQNGKGSELEARQLAGLFVFAEELQLHTAHEFKTANEHFLRVAGLIEATPDLRRKVARIRYANGEQGIELRNGARLKFMARSGGSGRGFAGASTVYFDEAMYLRAEMMGAALPTLSTHPNPQVIYTGSAGFADSSQLWALRRRALSGDGGRLAYLEHTAELVTVDDDGNVLSNRDEIDAADRDLWPCANPALGSRVSWEFVEAEFRSMPREQFLRERLGVWDAEPTAVGRAVISMTSWMACVDEGTDPVRPSVFAIDVTPDRSTAAVAFATALDDGRVHVGIVDHRPNAGTGWVREFVAEARDRSPDALIVTDDPALVAELGDGVTKSTTHQLVEACGSFYDAVAERRVRVRRQRALEDAISVATKRPLALGWAWDRRVGDVSCVVAATLAFHSAANRAPVAPLVFAY